MSENFIPGDQAQRERIASALDETLFVQAGAGTGKTKALVSRIVTLITSGRASVDSIAAITFTEAAAAELRDRVRRELEAQSIDAENSPAERERCLNAVRGLDPFRCTGGIRRWSSRRRSADRRVPGRV